MAHLVKGLTNADLTPFILLSHLPLGRPFTLRAVNTKTTSPTAVFRSLPSQSLEVADDFQITYWQTLAYGAECSCSFVIHGVEHVFERYLHFQLIYWDAFCLALLEELENRGGTPREELRAWQSLLHIINESMLAGYLDAKSGSRE